MGRERYRTDRRDEKWIDRDWKDRGIEKTDTKQLSHTKKRKNIGKM